MELQSSASALDELGFASTMPELSAASISEWLKQTRVKKICRYPDVAKAIVKWLNSDHTQSIEPLSTALWRQREFS
jgi:hypothetical protein